MSSGNDSELKGTDNAKKLRALFEMLAQQNGDTAPPPKQAPPKSSIRIPNPARRSTVTTVRPITGASNKHATGSGMRSMGTAAGKSLTRRRSSSKAKAAAKAPAPAAAPAPAVANAALASIMVEDTVPPPSPPPPAEPPAEPTPEPSPPVPDSPPEAPAPPAAAAAAAPAPAAAPVVEKAEAGTNTTPPREKTPEKKKEASPAKLAAAPVVPAPPKKNSANARKRASTPVPVSAVTMAKLDHLRKAHVPDETPSANETTEPSVLTDAGDDLEEQEEVPLFTIATLPENLVFEGSGTKAVAFAGALQVLGDHGFLKDVKRYSGSSSGCLPAACLAVGYTPDEFAAEASAKNLAELQDADNFDTFRDTYSLLRDFGKFSGNAMHAWFGALIAKKTENADFTFKQLYETNEKELVITGTCVNRHTTKYFHRFSTPDMPIRDAMRISMGLPFLYAAVKENSTGNIFVDGSFLNNYPIYMFDVPFDANWTVDKARGAVATGRTLGLKLYNSQEVKRRSQNAGAQPVLDVNAVKDFSLAVVETLSKFIDSMTLKPGDWERTIAIDTGTYSQNVIALDAKDKKMLMAEGTSSAKKFISQPQWADIAK